MGGPLPRGAGRHRNEIHIPVGRRVRLDLGAADVIHSFWVPQLAGKLDMIPGRTNVTWLQADQPDIYRGECQEYCGIQHAHMAFLVVAEPPAQFDSYLAAGIMGANISPYMLYFYSSGAREEGWSERSLGVDRATAILGIGLGGLGQLAILLLSAMALEPLHIQDSTHAEIGLPLVVAVGAVGAFLRAAILLTTCCWGTALELCTTIPYIIAQGFGWEWGKDKKPAEAARYSLVVVLFRRSLGG